MSDSEGQRLITGYVPITALSIVGIACFGALAAIYWFRTIRSFKRWMLALTIGATTMTLGFCIRVPMHNNPGSLGIYIGQYMLILLSPCAFLAQDYVILPRLATWLDAEDCLFFSSRKIVRIFVWSDVLTFFLQAAGGGMTATDGESMRNIGHWIAVVGLVLQLLSFLTFVCLAIVFGLRVKSRHPEKWTKRVMTSNAHGSSTVYLRWNEDWRVLYWALMYTAVGFIIRSVFRTIEFAEGYDSKLRTVEWYFYVFDTLPIFLAIAVYAVVWPPNYVPEDHKHFAGLPNVQSTGSGYYGMQQLHQGDSPSSIEPIMNKPYGAV